MSLGHMEAVPVDTHIFKVAGDVYLPHIKKYKSLNAKIYNEVSDHFRLLHGSYAGWANTVSYQYDVWFLLCVYNVLIMHGQIMEKLYLI